jgi:hypothetical protein
MNEVFLEDASTAKGGDEQVDVASNIKDSIRDL